LDLLTLQDKCNMHILSVNAKFICTRCETGQKSRKTLKIRKEASLKEYLSKYNIEKGWESFHQVIHKHWKRYLREIIIQAFLACFAASANKFCIYRQYMHIAFILQCQKIQNKLCIDGINVCYIWSLTKLSFFWPLIHVEWIRW
jgi:hypothetical protein